MKKANKRSSAASVESCTLAPVSKAPAIATATAAYGKQILVTPSRELTAEFGQAFTLRSLYRAIQFCQSFADEAIVSTLSTQR